MTGAFDELGASFLGPGESAPYHAVWGRVRRGVELAVLESHPYGVKGIGSVRVGDRDLLATATVDETVRLWDPATGRVVMSLEGHTNLVNEVCSVRVGDRDLLASAADDRTVRLWDPATGRPVMTIRTRFPALAVTATVPGHVVIGGTDGLLVVRIDEPERD